MAPTNVPNKGIKLTGGTWDHGHGETYFVGVSHLPSEGMTVTIDEEGVIHDEDEWDRVLDAWSGGVSYYQNNHGPVKNGQNRFYLDDPNGDGNYTLSV